MSAVAIGSAPALVRLYRSWRFRAAVTGESMLPGLRAGDWLLVDPDAFASRRPREGDLIVVPDPRDEERWLVKRVRSVDEQGRLQLAGDRPDRSTDSRVFGPVDAATVRGRPWARYWPPSRLGRVR
ncbi:MAG: nickel-type superoxide dismutase maturation protease [Chloroflexota bacterium]|nr:nickel-type superoxide dismutase maturation protease [Chloroflexota bacterium]